MATGKTEFFDKFDLFSSRGARVLGKDDEFQLYFESVAKVVGSDDGGKTISVAGMKTKARLAGLNVTDFAKFWSADGDAKTLSREEFLKAAQINKKEDGDSGLTLNEFNRLTRGAVSKQALMTANELLAGHIDIKNEETQFHSTPIKPPLADLKKIAETHKLILDNRVANIDLSRLVIFFPGEKKETGSFREYKFGVEEIGDGKGEPLRLLIPPGANYEQIEKFMLEVRQIYFSADDKFKSIAIDSHAGTGDVEGWYDQKDKGVGFSIFPDEKNEIAAPFYQHTYHLSVKGCDFFRNLNAEGIEKIRKIASDNKMRIDGGLSIGYLSWSADTDEGGNKISFTPDGIVRLRRRADQEQYNDKEGPVSDGEVADLKQLWREGGMKFIDQRNAPQVGGPAELRAVNAQYDRVWEQIKNLTKQMEAVDRQWKIADASYDIIGKKWEAQRAKWEKTSGANGIVYEFTRLVDYAAKLTRKVDGTVGDHVKCQTMIANLETALRSQSIDPSDEATQQEFDALNKIGDELKKWVEWQDTLNSRSGRLNAARSRLYKISRQLEQSRDRIKKKYDLN